MLFAWDEGKAEENERKHRVTFAEAETVFDEPLAKTFLDPDHSEGEERYLDRLGIPILRRPSRLHGVREKCMGDRA
jgi:uncharacterized DUF497 family protein